MKLWNFLFIATTLFSMTAAAADREYLGPYQMDVYRVVDGDTIWGHIHKWPGEIQEGSIRIIGYDTPETYRPKCDTERKNGLAATRHLADLFGSESFGAVLGKPMAVVQLKNIQADKYGGRWDADVFFNGRNLSDIMLGDLVHDVQIRPYHGEKRKSWCDG